MIVTETDLPGVLVIQPRVFRDQRGFFLETFNAARFAEHGLPVNFVQDNHSCSVARTLRGLHFQTRRPQGKLVSVISGAAFDVAVDVRRGSPTFGRWTGLRLDAAEPRFVWIPPGFAHGFCALSESVHLVYKCTELYDPGDEAGVLWSDPGIAVDWPVREPLLSDRDRTLPLLTPDRDDLPRYAPAP